MLCSIIMIVVILVFISLLNAHLSNTFDSRSLQPEQKTQFS